MRRRLGGSRRPVRLLVPSSRGEVFFYIEHSHPSHYWDFNCSKISLPMPNAPRIVLTPQLAREIYAHKLTLQTPWDARSCLLTGRLLRGQSARVAQVYNVSAKTIRDIWNRISWRSATCGLWEEATVDPFHDDWPHWNRAVINPQSGSSSGPSSGRPVSAA